MDRDFLFTDRLEPLAWDEALRLAATDRAVLLERLTEDANRPRLFQGLHYDRTEPRLRRWTWDVTNTTTGEVLSDGRAATKRGAIRRRFRAYNRVLAQLNDGQAES